MSNQKADYEDMIQAMFSGYEAEELDASMEAEKDVLGTRAVSYLVQKDDAVIEMALQGMQEALGSTPDSQKEAYTEALRVAPKVVELETPMRRFLLACDFNYWAAAKQLIQNWQERKDIFGDRFCLPMKIPEGPEPTALTSDVVANLQSGGVFLAKPDNYSRAVIVTDMDVVSEEYRMSLSKIRQKLYFYMLQIASEEDLAIVNGVIHMIAYNSPSTESLTSKCKQDGSICSFFINTNCAAKPCAHHFYAMKKTSFITRNLISLKDFISTFRNLQFRIRVHMEDSNESILYSISQYGFSKEHMLKRSGGVANGREWYEKRLQKDQQYMYKSGAKHGIKKEHDNRSKAVDSSLRQIENQKRKMQRFQVWAEDHLAKHKLLRLKAEVEELERNSTTLHQEQAFLESQIACAEYFATKFENDLTLIESHLAESLSTIPGVDPHLLSANKEKQRAVAKSLFHKYLLFLGKSPMTGLFLLDVRSDLSVEQTHFAEGLKTCLMEELYDGQPPDKLPAPTVGQRSKEIALMEFEEERRQDVDVKPRAGPRDGETLTRELEQARHLVASLSRQKEMAQRESDFLHNGLYTVTQLAMGFDQFRKMHTECLSGFYASVLAYYTNHSGPWGTYALAEFVLAHFTYFDGRYFRNPIAELAADKKHAVRNASGSTGMQQSQSYQLALQVVQPIMKPFLQHGNRENFKNKSTNHPPDANDSSMETKVTSDERRRSVEEEQARRRREYRLQRKKSLKRL